MPFQVKHQAFGGRFRFSSPGLNRLYLRSLFSALSQPGGWRFYAAFLIVISCFPGRVHSKTLFLEKGSDPLALQMSINSANDGDILIVRGGIYPGPLRIDKSITLRGVDDPSIDGNNNGTVVVVQAPDVTIEGFTIKNSGSALDKENAGLTVAAPGAVIRNNRIVETLFGIYLRQSDNSRIESNTIYSKMLDLPRRGDPVRIWFSNNVIVRNNTIGKGRDVVLWYSRNIHISGNDISGGRYGLHFMYCDDAVIEQNRLTDNSVGAFLMYSRRLSLRRNTIADNRGASGYGIGLKDMDDPVLEDNLFADNRVGVYLDNSPRELDSSVIIRGNLFIYNDVGMHLLPSVRQSRITGNSFLENTEQVQMDRGSRAETNVWEGNYWSDYVGYDGDGDHIGDIAYRSDRLFENLIERYPMFRMFLFSPSVSALEWASRVLPAVKPQPKFVDRKPHMNPTYPKHLPVLQTSSIWPLRSVTAVLVGLGILGFFNINFQRKWGAAEKPSKKPSKKTAPDPAPVENALPVIQCRGLSKCYGRDRVLKNFDLDLLPGECLALWGENGAGKTTALRCLLGLIHYEGKVSVFGLDPLKNGKAVRHTAGYIPQQIALYGDLSVRETFVFFCRLRNLSPASIEPVLDVVNVRAYLNQKVKNLSGGIRQRMTLGIALLSKPKLLFLDEPTANLDANSRQEFLFLLNRLKKDGITLVFASHRMEEVKAIADRVVVLKNGEIAMSGSSDHLEELLKLRTTIIITLPEDYHEEAFRILEKKGYTPISFGRAIHVSVSAGERLSIVKSFLKEEQIPVTDIIMEPEHEL